MIGDCRYSPSMYTNHPMDYNRVSRTPLPLPHHYSTTNRTDLLTSPPMANETLTTKKQPWLEFFYESRGNPIKDEVIDECQLNELSSGPSNDVNYTMINSQMHSFNSNRLSSFEQQEKHQRKTTREQRKVRTGDDGEPRAATSPEERRRCAVCNDTASGYHYGVWSCEGCKAFFKRSIQGTNEYICPATNTCTIDKHRRKSCQACRLRRCYEVGMTKGTTRRERKHRRKAVSVCKITSTSSTNNSNYPTNHLPDPGLTHSIAPSRPSTGTPSVSQNNNPNNSNTITNGTYSSASVTAVPQSSQTISKSNFDGVRLSTPPADFIATLSHASRLNLPAKVDPNRPLDDQYFLQLLAKIFDQELVVLINWAKAIPGYTESLTLDQQVTIIEQSWLDTLILDIVERSLNHPEDTLHFAPDLVISRHRDLSSRILGSICTYLFQLVQVFREPRTTHEEFIALKATILINSVPSTISLTKSFRLLTSQIYHSIKYACDTNPSIYHDTSIRHMTLLLQLPHIKMLSNKLMKVFFEMRANDLLPQADLLLEMLDAQDTLDMSLQLNSNGNPSSSMYSNQFSSMSTLDIDLPTKSNSSTSSSSFYPTTSNDLTSNSNVNHGHYST